MGNLDVMKKVLEAANRHEPGGPPELFGDKMVFENPALPGPSDREGYRQFHSTLFAGFPDIVYHTDNMMETGDTVVTECTVEGTHRGEFAGVPATNRTVRQPVAFIVHFEGGKIRHWKSYFDQVGMLRQLGALPEGK